MSGVENGTNGYPDIIRKFIAALAKAEDWINADHAEESKIDDEEYVAELQYYYHGLFVS